MMKILKSRTVWAIVAMFVIGGTEAVSGFISPIMLPYVQGALGLLATYFKLNPSQEYNS